MNYTVYHIHCGTFLINNTFNVAHISSKIVTLFIYLGITLIHSAYIAKNNFREEGAQRMNKKYTLSCKEFGLQLAKLREHKGISARQMSLDIGQNKNYINSIETGHNYPNMHNFFCICEYLHVTPQSFFQSKDMQYVLHEEFIQIICELPPDQYHHLYLLACDLREHMQQKIHEYNPD